MKPIKYVVVKRDSESLKVLTRPDNITRASNMFKRMTAIGIENLGVEANSKEFRKILREERKRSAAARASLKKALQAARKEVDEERKNSEEE